MSGAVSKACLAALLLLLWSAPAWGQQPQAQPSREQLALMHQGAQAYQAGDFARAEVFYRRALELGDLNIAWLNLGRLLQKQGRCQDAQAALERALVTPAVSSPAPSQVRDTVARYRAQMRDHCPASLLVWCPQPQPRLYLQGRPFPCNQAQKRPPGAYTLEVVQGDQRQAHTVQLQATELSTVDLRPAPALEEIAPAPQGPSAPGDPELRQLAGWSLVGLGGASLATGGLFSYLLLDNDQDVAALARQPQIKPERADALMQKGDRYHLAQYIGYGLGAALVATGGFLLWTDRGDQGEAALRWRWWGPGGAVQARW